MKNMTITFSDTTRDFAGWVCEKTGYVLQSLCRELRENPEVRNNENFKFALCDSLKIYGLCCGNLNGISHGLVVSLLLERNIDGFDFLKDMINGTENSSIMVEILQAKRNEEILALIEQNVRTNRTEIARLLGRSNSGNRWIEKVRDDIELVHNNERDWAWFYNRHKDDRNTFNAVFANGLIHEVYEYFQSDDYKYADADLVVDIS